MKTHISFLNRVNRVTITAFTITTTAATTTPAVTAATITGARRWFFSFFSIQLCSQRFCGICDPVPIIITHIDLCNLIITFVLMWDINVNSGKWLSFW
ncbi:hypothetical protein Hanom_Chr17g01571611 [Helianthus anomalus]